MCSLDPMFPPNSLPGLRCSLNRQWEQTPKHSQWPWLPRSIWAGALDPLCQEPGSGCGVAPGLHTQSGMVDTVAGAHSRWMVESQRP